MRHFLAHPVVDIIPADDEVARSDGWDHFGYPSE